MARPLKLGTRLPGSPEPGVLPSHRDVLVIPTVPDVGTVAVAELQRLVPADPYGDGSSDAGVFLLGAGVLDAIQTGLAAQPEIPVKRSPKPRLHIVAQVSFKCANGFFRLSGHAKVELVARKEFGIRSEEPRCSICIEKPVPPALRQADFRFESPPVTAIIDKFCRVVLAGRCYYLEAYAEKSFLSPGSRIRGVPSPGRPSRSQRIETLSPEVLSGTH